MRTECACVAMSVTPTANSKQVLIITFMRFGFSDIAFHNNRVCLIGKLRRYFQISKHTSIYYSYIELSYTLILVGNGICFEENGKRFAWPMITDRPCSKDGNKRVMLKICIRTNTWNLDHLQLAFLTPPYSLLPTPPSFPSLLPFSLSRFPAAVAAVFHKQL